MSKSQRTCGIKYKDNLENITINELCTFSLNTINWHQYIKYLIKLEYMYIHNIIQIPTSKLLDVYPLQSSFCEETLDHTF